MTRRRDARPVYALFADPADAQRAVDDLEAGGVPPAAIVVVSAEPHEAYAFSRRHASTWLPWIALAGGAVGLSAATALLVGTQNAWPIVTSGMPIVAWWPNLIIMFELTMLGAILATVGTLVFAVILPGRRGLYDPAVSDGAILVGVEHADDEPRVAGILTGAGGRVPA